MRLTAAMDGLDISRGPACDTPAPKNITGSLNILGGLNRKYRLFYSLFNVDIQYKSL